MRWWAARSYTCARHASGALRRCRPHAAGCWDWPPALKLCTGRSGLPALVALQPLPTAVDGCLRWHSSVHADTHVHC